MIRRSQRYAALLGTGILLLALCSCASAPAGEGPANVAEVAPEVQLETARAALAADDTNPENWFQLGLAWQRQANADSAQAAYEHAMQIDPGHVKAIVHSGLVLEERGLYNEALARYDMAAAIAPQDPTPLVNKGSLLYFQFKKTFDAKTALAKALELDPDNADAHFNLGVLFADASMFREAAVEWEKVLAVAPEGPARALAEENLERIRPVLDGAAAAGGDSGSEP